MDNARTSQAAPWEKPEALEALRAQMPALQNQIYLNTGTSGPMPQPVSEVQIEWVHRLAREGGGSASFWKAMGQLLADTREAWARILGADDVGEIALTHNASEGLALVAAALDWQPGDEVIVSELEHISGLLPWAQLQRTRGIAVRYIRAQDGQLDPAAVEEAFSPRTRLLCFSHVSYSTGAILPARQLIDMAASRGVLTLMDGAQSVGHIPLKLSELGCDFYAVPGHKWLLGPEGSGALYIRKERLAQLEPPLQGWASAAVSSVDFSDTTQEILHPDARRFEVATAPVVVTAGVERAIRFMEELGSEAVWNRIHRLSSYCRQALQSLPGVTVLGANRPAEFSGLVSFSVEGRDPAQVVEYLFQEHKIVCRSIPHSPLVRVSLHAFNTEEEVDRLVAALRELPSL